MMHGQTKIKLQILTVVFDYIYRYLWSCQHNGDVSPKNLIPSV